MRREGKLPYKIIGAIDTETTNIHYRGTHRAFCILYQLGIINGDVENVTAENVGDSVITSLFRDHERFYDALDDVIDKYRGDVVPVILVHNLGFDMYPLMPWLLGHSVRVLAKTARKPITFTILDDDGNPEMCLLDTLGLFLKSLDTMGRECGMPKATGAWDYMRVRTADTPLTESEEFYAVRDIHTLIAYMGYFLRQNPDINPDDIGLRVVTKTGVVRAKRMAHLGGLKPKRGGSSVARMWTIHNFAQKPQSDHELFVMQACTRGGHTFCASNHASQVYECDDDHTVLAVDATSMHPSHMVSHLYPVNFVEASEKGLATAAKLISGTTPEHIISRFQKPFPVAVNACYEFEGLRPKEGSRFERDGIYPLASSRFAQAFDVEDYGNNESQTEFRAHIADLGYGDECVNGVFKFGKLESADWCRIWVTELSLWEVFQCYDYDSITPVCGFYTLNFRKPSDMCVLSVMRFYRAKNALKESMHDGNGERLQGLFPQSFVDDMISGDATEQDIGAYYMLSKADLNALFGIEATNEARRDFELTKDGMHLVGEDGLHNMPEHPKCWYQFGQRIVGWSRVAQNVVMQLVDPYVDDVIYGDTDSLKLFMAKNNVAPMKKALHRYYDALTTAKVKTCERARKGFSEHYDDLDGIGAYVVEGEFSHFCASWNKCYISYDGERLDMTIAGLPTRRGIDVKASWMLDNGYTFADVANTFIGYNVTYDYMLTMLNSRSHPEFGEMFAGEVTDYRGVTSHVYAPAALALYPESKTIGDTDKVDNAVNASYALENNPGVNIEPILLRRCNMPCNNLNLDNL